MRCIGLESRVAQLREQAEEHAQARRDAEFGPGGGNPKAKAEDHLEWKAADEIERLHGELAKEQKKYYDAETKCATLQCKWVGFYQRRIAQLKQVLSDKNIAIPAARE